jgi:hypothetical protein
MKCGREKTCILKMSVSYTLLEVWVSTETVMYNLLHVPGGWFIKQHETGKNITGWEVVYYKGNSDNTVN